MTLSMGTGPAVRRLAGSLPVLSTAIRVCNTGSRSGDEVVFMFHNGSTAAAAWSQRARNDGPDPLAIKNLVGFRSAIP